jgi:catechol 2,3-dioxygenase-like lactoylglutathione lyase family enzyme
MSDSQAAVKAPSFTFGFLKVVVRDLDLMLRFYEKGLGLVVTQVIENDTMIEKVLQKPGQQGGPSLLLFLYKDGREVTIGSPHGPMGFFVRDTDAAFAHAIANGASPYRQPVDIGNQRVAFVHDPEGYEIELVSVKR